MSLNSKGRGCENQAAEETGTNCLQLLKKLSCINIPYAGLVNWL
jgi:hypothetical protein